MTSLHVECTSYSVKISVYHVHNNYIYIPAVRVLLLIAMSHVMQSLVRMADGGTASLANQICTLYDSEMVEFQVRTEHIVPP